MKFLQTMALATSSMTMLGMAPAANAQPPAQIEPFLASYTIVWKGMSAGTTQIQLEPQDNGRFLYSSRSTARGVFRMVFSEEITQTSLLEFTEQGPRPLRYRGDDGTEKTDKDISLDFDWTAGRLTGTAENKPVDLPLPPGVQDTMSIQLALVRELRAGGKPMSYQLADKDQIKTYEYTYEGTARLKTALGELDTVIYRSHRADSSRRVIRMWHATSLGFIPVQAERLKDGKREWQMEIRSLKR